ncbi:MAG: NTP transferase domain-containing protein [Deltaproteobacteria bacterium]|nr:NTP transferase domain-containing protein [Deltaproteobacteria bacterium]
MKETKFCALILAAGKGTRMKSDLAKVLHVLNGEPLLYYSLKAAREAGAEKIVAVIGHQADKVREEFAGTGCIFVEQNPQLGTGHAVLQAKDVLSDYDGLTVILCGDVPLLKSSTIKSLIDNHIAAKAVVSVLTTIPPPPHAYGRIVKDNQGNVMKIVENKDATEEEKKIGEINTGIYCVDTKFLFEALGKITNDNQQHEYYLTDIVEIAVRERQKVKSFIADDYVEVMGINTLEELARAEKYLQII